MLNILENLKNEKVISESEYYFARMIADKQQKAPELQRNLAILLAALCQYSHQQGNTCLFLDEQLQHNFFGLAYRKSERDYQAQLEEKIRFLAPSQWQSALHGHVAFTTEPERIVAPFVFQFNALYFYRVWQDEFRVANYLKSAVLKNGDFQSESDLDAIRRCVRQEGIKDGQKLAIATALRQQFTLISGGPGTGKTFIVARLLVALQQLYHAGLKIRLAAPTGKAAARLTESISAEIARMALPQSLVNSIPTDGMTIHRLLGGRYFTYNVQNPLPIDVLVVDEASMIDLTLMTSLVQALQPNTRLILLGDKDQLASVEAGAIIGELGQFLDKDYSPAMRDYLQQVTDVALPYPQRQTHPMRDHLCHLTESRRFDADSDIGHLAAAINQMQAEESLKLFQTGKTIHWQGFDQYAAEESVRSETTEEAENNVEYTARCAELVLQSAVSNYRVFLLEVQKYAARPDITQVQLQAIFGKFKSVRFLAALRSGALGVEKLNQGIAERLRQTGLVRFYHSRDWYEGKPVMVVQNDLNVGLFNGDIGLFLHGKVWFEVGEGRFRAVSSSRVPTHEPAFVMTVHKSQGSEFAHTFFVLPTENSPVLCKELIYTAVTRARTEFTVFSSQSLWKAAVRKRVKRQSGLGLLLK
ncbi:exodeoxyribonuclease V subunit alpha [Pasteurellaceae bacterium LIM206]|nr:exodeoxyribonuclease V subunit alpha [Pasteurellaceae bacterium LIM206]